MAILRSSSFKGDPALEACAVQDAAHVVPGATGPHVRKIQRALNMVDDAGISDAELGEMRYGAETAAAVSAFKTKRKILNYAGRIDAIVGKKTIQALDSELLGIDLEREDVKDHDQYTDVIVRFVGGSDPDGEGWAINRIVTPGNYGKLNRKLVGLGFGAQLGQPDIKVQNAFRQINDLRNRGPIGLLCVRGSSRGGLWALQLARMLTAAQVPLSHVSLQDAAFSSRDAINTPSSYFDEFVDNVPLFPSLLVKADHKINHFQRAGNKAGWSVFRNERIWMSTDEKHIAEIHGEVQGFPSRLWSMPPGTTAGEAHNHCCGLAETDDLGVISGLLAEACQ